MLSAFRFLSAFSLALALSACGGGGSSSASVPPATGSGNTDTTVITPSTPTSTVTSTPTAQLQASKPGDLLGYIKAKLIAGQDVTQVLPGVSLASPAVAVATAAPVAAAASASTSAGADTSAASSNFSSTLVQETGVDEADWMKTDGSKIIALRPRDFSSSGISSHRLTMRSRASDGQLGAATTVNLDANATPSGMFYASSANRIVVLGNRYQGYSGVTPLPAVSSVSGASIAPAIAPVYGKNQVNIDVLPSNATNLTVTTQIRIDGSLVGSRQIGNVIYLVTQWTPNISSLYTASGSGLTITSARLNALTADQILPTISIGNPNTSLTSAPLMSETDCYLQTANAAAQVQLTNITAIDLSTPDLQRSSRCFLGGSDAVYVSPSNIYLSSSRYYAYAANATSTVFRSDSRTDIHKFSLNGLQISYKASGEVPGHLGWERDKASYRMSEYLGDLRVLSYTGSTGWWGDPAGVSSTVAAPSPATLTVLREGTSSATLSTVGSLPNAQRSAAIGKAGEQVYAVRFLGNRGYVVTFRRTDPLYVLDLSNPADPKTVGELTVPGFSDYLFPMSEALLLGVGKDADSTGRATGVKLALFNVQNASAPSLVTQTVIGSQGSASALDFSPRGINIFAQGDVQRIALPLRVNAISSNSSFGQPQSQGLYRWEVNTKTQSWLALPTLGTVNFSATQANTLPYGLYSLAYERSVQIGSNAIIWSGGQMTSFAW